MVEPLPPSFGSARDALHALAEHVIAPFRYRADGHIGLVVTPGGFGTPVLDDGERVRVDGIELVHDRPGTSTRVGLTTLDIAARFVDVPLGLPEGIYSAATPCAPEISVAVDADAARALAAWFDLGAALLSELRERYGGHNATMPTLWPEHFDLAMEMGRAEAGDRANYGASPGDTTIAQPYLYVGPWEESRRTGVLASYGFGAAITYDELLADGNPHGAGADFLALGANLLLGAP
jgi:hypothetical protein